MKRQPKKLLSIFLVLFLFLFICSCSIWSEDSATDSDLAYLPLDDSEYP